MFAIQTENLRKEYKNVVAVDDLNLSITKGELFALLGVNGAGKSTTIKMLAGLCQPTSGDAFLMGKSICKNPADIKKMISISPQDTAVASNLTVKENLQLMGGVCGLPKLERKLAISELVERFELSPVLNKQAHKLSGGFQRRLSIAMALVCRPEILYLDEPTLGLDVLARYDLWSLIRELKENMMIILTTHYMEEAEALADRVGIMKNGKLLVTGTPQELKNMTEKSTLENAFVSVIKGEF